MRAALRDPAASRSRSRSADSSASWPTGSARTGRTSAEAAVARRPEKVAIVGSGPAGLTAASDLAQLGYSVTVFEALHAIGGVLRYGIPEYRLPKAIVDEDVEHLRAHGRRVPDAT